MPGLDHEIEEAAIRIDQLALRLASTNRSDLDEALVLRSELASMQTKLQGLLVEQHELVIRAPISGTIIEFDRDAHVGRWITKSDRLALMSSGSGGVVRAYLSGDDHWRDRRQSISGRFVPDDITQSRPYR